MNDQQKSDPEMSASGQRLREGVDPFPARLQLLRWVGKQTWIPRGQDWIMRRIWHPDRGLHFLFEVDFFGSRYEGDLARSIDWMVFAYGSYAYSELTLLEALAVEMKKRRGHVYFFDVGANVGHHALFMANRSDEVIAFEPFAPLRQLIQQKAERNHLDHLRIVPFALGEADEDRKYYPGASVNPGMGTFLPQEGDPHQEPVALEIRNGDSLCEGLKLPQIDILKVDVQGYEPMVFRGLAQRIQRDRPPILTEFSAQSRAGYASEEAFRRTFWDGAVFCEVRGRSGCAFELKPFVYGKTEELLVLPPEMASFAESQMVH